jgi:hypothetical protein
MKFKRAFYIMLHTKRSNYFSQRLRLYMHILEANRNRNYFVDFRFGYPNEYPNLKIISVQVRVPEPKVFG